MTAQSNDRMVYMSGDDGPRCMTAAGMVKLPAEFLDVLGVLSCDLHLALDCVLVFGGVPKPVAKAILRNLEPVQCALDLALKEAGN